MNNNERQEERVEMTDEKIRFESKGPLATLLTLSVGPLTFNCGISLHDAVDLLLIARALHENSLEIVVFSSLIRYLCMCVTIFFAQSTIAKISSFLGAGQKREAAQVTTDLFRISFVSMIFVALIFYFASIPMLEFMGCSDPYEARRYLLPILCSIPFIALFQLSCGFLQSQGRSLFVGALQFGVFALNCGFLSPIMLFAIKVPLRYAGVSFALSQSIPGLILTFLIFKGKFGIEPDVSMFFKGISMNTLQALFLGLPFLLNILAGALPPMVLLSYMMKAAKKEGTASTIAAVYSVFLKIQSAVNSVSIGINQGMMACGSYSRGTNNYSRILHLYKWALICTFLYHVCWIPIMMTRADLVANIWMDNKVQLEASKSFLRIPFYTNCLIPLADSTVNFLLACGKPAMALIPSFARAIVCLVATFGLYYTGADKPMRMMYTSTACDVTNLVIAIGLAFYGIQLLRTKQLNLNLNSLLSDPNVETNK